MKKAALRSGGLVVALAACCAAFAAGNASAAVPSKSVTQCYATRGNPSDVVCYRNSWKAEYRNGDMVYVPILIQVPTPSHSAPVILVQSLDDIRPANMTPGAGAGTGAGAR
ncbi:hypothetical protein [Streptomyces sp. NPDC048191]|uniref:hypothetical protein n=1 Tax=Streptomyces sp. NPDC048191 TaxID=3155484 RepID=UPI0033EB0A2C